MTNEMSTERPVRADAADQVAEEAARRAGVDGARPARMATHAHSRYTVSRPIKQQLATTATAIKHR